MTEPRLVPGIEGQRERPPWIRLSRITGSSRPDAVWWWPTEDACWACGVPDVMEGRMRRPGLDKSRSPLLCGATRVWPLTTTN